ncbi:MAG: TetR/AcrR family transcriptional regulator [Acidimicrobiales bacterium]
MTASERSGEVSLLHEQRQVARDRIERAARQVLADKGIGATVEDVAAEARVSIRTVFRHYGTRDHMIASALGSQLSHYSDTLPVPEDGATLESWLPELLREVHRVNALLGRAYWEMAALGDTLTGEVGAVAAQRLAGRNRFVNVVARGAWRLAGHRTRPPSWLVDLFAIHLSAFTTRELVSDFGRSVDDVASMSSRVLIAAVRSVSPNCSAPRLRSAP